MLQIPYATFAFGEIIWGRQAHQLLVALRSLLSENNLWRFSTTPRSRIRIPIRNGSTAYAIDLRESQFSGELIDSFSAISGTIKPAAMGCGSFVLISARVIEFTIRDLERRSSCYCVADRNERKPRILIRPSIIGRTISGD